MNLGPTDFHQDPVGALRRAASLPMAPLSELERVELCRDLDARGIKYTIVRGVPVVQQGFAPAVKGENVFEQCLQMNRQAVVRSPAQPSK